MGKVVRSKLLNLGTEYDIIIKNKSGGSFNMSEIVSFFDGILDVVTSFFVSILFFFFN